MNRISYVLCYSVHTPVPVVSGSHVHVHDKESTKVCAKSEIFDVRNVGSCVFCSTCKYMIVSHSTVVLCI